MFFDMKHRAPAGAGTRQTIRRNGLIKLHTINQKQISQPNVNDFEMEKKHSQIDFFLLSLSAIVLVNNLFMWNA